MARAHLFRPVTDEEGNLLYGAQVTVRREDVNAPLDQDIFAGPVSVEPMTNPFVIHGGYIDIWLDEPQRVNFLIESPPRAPISIFLDVHPPANEVLRTVYPLTITNEPYNGAILVGTSAEEASFQDAPTITPGAAPPHDHDGSGVNSTALGTAANASGARSTAVGDSAAANHPDATAFGFQAAAGSTRATAVGATAAANGEDSTAIGFGSQAGTDATAVGLQAAAGGGRSVAVGKQAQASGDGAVALGNGASASGESAVAVGQNAMANNDGAVALGAGSQATYARATAVGNGAESTADDQVALGGADSTVVVLGDTIAEGAVSIAGGSSTLRFFGAAGATRQTITGVVSDPALAALLSVLHGMGLVDDQTTA